MQLATKTSLLVSYRLSSSLPSKAVAPRGRLHGPHSGLQRGIQPAKVLRVRHQVGALLTPGMNCSIKIGLPGKLILSKRKGLREVLFSC